jgi:uncharacterized membrane protein
MFRDFIKYSMIKVVFFIYFYIKSYQLKKNYRQTRKLKEAMFYFLLLFYFIFILLNGSRDG